MNRVYETAYGPTECDVSTPMLTSYKVFGLMLTALAASVEDFVI